MVSLVGVRFVCTMILDLIENYCKSTARLPGSFSTSTATCKAKRRQSERDC